MAQWGLPGQLNQLQLIPVISTTVKVIPGKIWSSSLKKIDLHPHYLFPFLQWIINIYMCVNTG